MLRTTVHCFIVASLIFSAFGCEKQNARPKVAFVTNCVASFWLVAEKGAIKGAEDFDVDVEIVMPPNGTVEEQNRMVQDLLAKRIDGIAISPKDPTNQGPLLKEIAENTIFITQDSDAPESARLCYIGMSNYDAGWLTGELIKEAIPNGGEVMLFVGNIEQLNAKLRRQGVIDCLLDRTKDKTRYDNPGSPIVGKKYTILATKTDLGDHSTAKSQAQDAIVKYPNLKCMIGLFAYNPPLCLEAVREAGKLKKIKLIAFDEQSETLQGILDGEIYGTVVQDPYRYGYESIRILAGLKKGDKSVLPKNGFLDIPAQQIRIDTVSAFWKKLKERTGAK